MGNKRFKDPIYGYIDIEEKMISRVIDTAVFQRLRDVIQTSYSPLYSSAIHNRFVHSIGVYHLGKMAAEAFQNSCADNLSDKFPEIEQYLNIFTLACLLHDVGHAPFSHTGEEFYLKEAKCEELHAEIIGLISDSTMKKEIVNNSYKAAPHELMSVIVSLKAFGNMIPDEKKIFFARCIIGYKYAEDMNSWKRLLNCLIELLNSKIIDVDKLDYLIRDSYMTGFDTVKIDYVRLLKSIQVVYIGDEYRICYNKSAVSVIENVVYAHDAERKWIQNHPTVLYEAYLIQNSFQQIMDQFMSNGYLEYAYLTEEGKEIASLGRVRLIGDSDIIYLMKNLRNCRWTDEYFGRQYRKHPIWKTEAEFQAIFGGNESAIRTIENEFEALSKSLRSMGLPFIINQKALDACKKDAEEVKKGSDAADEKQQEKDAEVIKTRNNHVRLMQILRNFAAKEKIDFDFDIILAKQFNSGFRKQEFAKVEIIFPELSDPCKFGEVSNVLTASESKGENFFYLYYRRNANNQGLRIVELVEELLTLAYAIEADDKIQKGKKRLK